MYVYEHIKIPCTYLYYDLGVKCDEFVLESASSVFSTVEILKKMWTTLNTILRKSAEFMMFQYCRGTYSALSTTTYNVIVIRDMNSKLPGFSKDIAAPISIQFFGT